MPFRIDVKKYEDVWEECWVYPVPKDYAGWIKEYYEMTENFPEEKFRLVRYKLEIRLSNDLTIDKSNDVV